MMRLLAVGSVAALLLSQAAFLRAQDSPEPRKESVRAFSLRVSGDGHVEMTVQEDGKEKTYKADSMEEFTRQYPELARKYGVGRGVHAWTFRDHGDLTKKLEELQKHFGSQGPDLRKLLEDSRGPKAKGRAGDDAASGPRLGVMLAPLSEALAEQLGLDAGRGALVDDVEVGSAAEKSGLKKHDVLLKVDGKDVSGAESVRSTVREALKKREFDVQVLRHGKEQTIKVQSPKQE
jgi:membrane-associated protease RseP (regulator of RpoE activity)